MAMNDIALTSGMRSNLVQLQATVTLLDRTQERLATGKKVNTPLDNPINYFAAAGHLTRASDILQYKDGMAEGIQTIQAANAGIKGIQGLIESARSLGQSALAANPNQVGFTVNAALSGATFTIGGAVFSAVGTGASSVTEFNVSDTDGNALSADEIASNLTAKINQNTETLTGAKDIKAVQSGDRITLQAAAVDKTITYTAIAAASVAGNFTLDEEVTSARKALATQYESLLSQIDTLAGASGYKGNNLLTKDTLSVRFEGGAITIKGFNAYASDLSVNTTGLAKATTVPTTGPYSAWAVAKDIRYDISNMDKGLENLKAESSKLSSAVSVISIQQDFSTTKINLLYKGADNLTAADTNEEGANMLMLQTRQALSTTALSMSSQASQSVLRLFA
jgi:flagellin-like hook-associated protein FlgL